MFFCAVKKETRENSAINWACFEINLRYKKEKKTDLLLIDCSSLLLLLLNIHLCKWLDHGKRISMQNTLPSTNMWFGCIFDCIIRQMCYYTSKYYSTLMQAQMMECSHVVHVLVVIPIRLMRIRHAIDLSYKFAIKKSSNSWCVVNIIFCL